LTAEAIETALSRFRGWLQAWAATDAAPPDDGEPPIDLAAIVGAVAALRHEVHLLTRAARAQSEQAADALELAREAAATSRPVPADDELLGEMANAAEALARCERGLRRALDAAASGWRRWFGGARSRDALAAAADGLALARQRIDAALERHGLTPIAAVGQPFDPEVMEALEVLTDGQAAPGTVVEEVRRGYRRHDTVFRCAVVKVAGDGR
jgi:molecular chaperone GrpE